MIQSKAQRIRQGIAITLPLTLMLLFILFPFYWCINTSLKSQKEIVSRTVNYWPASASFDNYVRAWKNVGFSKYFLNSVIIAVTVMLCIIIIAILMAYAMTRFKFKGKPAVLLLLLCTQFLPKAMLLVPLFNTFKALQLINSQAALVISYIAFQLPFNVVLMTGFLADIPYEIEEAAMIDGCNRLQAIARVILPILVPAIVAVGAFSFIDAWKEFLFALMFINDPNRMTIPVGLSYMLGEYGVEYATLAAGCLIAVIPPVLLFSYIQKYLVQGLSAGAVKG